MHGEAHIASRNREIVYLIVETDLVLESGAFGVLVTHILHSFPPSSLAPSLSPLHPLLWIGHYIKDSVAVMGECRRGSRDHEVTV